MKRKGIWCDICKEEIYSKETMFIIKKKYLDQWYDGTELHEMMSKENQHICESCWNKICLEIFNSSVDKPLKNPEDPITLKEELEKRRLQYESILNGGN